MFAILFFSAGRLDYWQGWVYFFLRVFVYTFNWVIIPSELVYERHQPGARAQKWDSLLVYGVGLPLHYTTLLIAVLDSERRHWSCGLPLWVNISGFAVIFSGYSLMTLSLWKNPFFSAIVRI